MMNKGLQDRKDGPLTNFQGLPDWAGRAVLALLLLSLGACTGHSLAPATSSPPPAGGAGAVAKTHPRFAPPPAVSSHWDARLGVYVLDDEQDTFYRERTFYRWNAGWSRADNLQGAWEQVDSSAIPPALYRSYAQ